MSSEATLKMIVTGADRGGSGMLRGVGNEADRAAGKWAKFGKFAKAGALAAAAGIGAAVAVGVKLAKGAAEDEQATKRLALQSRNSAHATQAQIDAQERWITAVGKSKGVADDDLRPALGRLVAVTHSVSKAQKLTSLGMNIAAGTGKSLTAVTTALAKAQNGSVGGLARLGAKTKDAAGHTRSLRDITSDLAQTYKGQAAAAADTTAGKYQRLKVIFSEAGESIGYKLLPLGLKLANFLINTLVPAAEKAGTWLGAKLGPVIQQLSGWISGTLIPALTRLGNWITTSVIPVIRDLAEKGLAILQKAVGNVTSHLGALEPTVRLIIAAFKAWWAIASNVVLPVMMKYAGIVFPLLGKAIGAIISIIGALSKAVIWLWNNAFQPVFVFIAKAIATAFEWVGKLLSALGHVPGFGWAKKLGNDMQDAAGQARGLADNIKKIPSSKNVKIQVQVVKPKAPLTGLATLLGGHNAVGTRYSAGGMRVVGERGPELVDMSRGSRVYTAQETAQILGGGSGASGGDLGTLTLDVTQDGKVIQRKLLKLKREQGGTSLGIA